MSEDNYQYQNNQFQKNHENEMEEVIDINQEINNPIINENPSMKKLKDIHEIVSEEENKTYTLKFIPKGNNLKILLTEQDNFPAKIYELYLDLEELKLKNDLFSIYTSTKELSDLLNKSDNNITFTIKKKPENIMSLTIIFPTVEDNNIDNDVEIDLNENIIDDREMFRQLFEKYKSIQQEQDEDINQFLNRIKNIEEILKAHEEPPVPENQEMQGEEQNGEEHNDEEHAQEQQSEVRTEEKGEIAVENEEVKLSPILEEASSKHGFKLVVVDVDKNNELSSEFSVSSIPHVILFHKGGKISEFKGFDTNALQKMIYYITKNMNKFSGKGVSIGGGNAPQAKNCSKESGNIPEEPPEGDDTYEIGFRYNNETFSRRFLCVNTIGQLKDYVRSKIGVSNISLFTPFPRKVYDDDNAILLDVGLSKREMLNVGLV